MPTALFDRSYVETISGETFDETEGAQVDEFVLIAQAKLRSKVAALDERIAAGTLDGTLVKGTGAAMVLRALATVRRGIGVTRTEYPEISEQYASATRTGLVYLTDDELDDLLDVPESSGDSFSIVPGADQLERLRARHHRHWPTERCW